MAFSCADVANAFLGEPTRKQGSELLWPCPRHDDQHPSLKVNSNKDCWACFPCNASGNAWELAAFILHLDPDNKPAMTAALRERGLLSNNGKRIIAVYPYQSETGEVLYEKARYEPKTFRLRRPDGNGGWVYDLKGVRPILFNLPQVLKAQSLLICEGERDCETAKQFSLVATTSGAAGSWRPEFAEILKGKRVTIIADADEPGRKYAREVARSLVGIAESLRLLEMPGAKDLSEWVECGGTMENFLELVNETPTLTSADIVAWGTSGAPPKTGLQLVSVGALLAEPTEPVRWLLEDHLPAAGLSLLASKPKVGKSTWARGLALAVARGEPFMGRATQQGPVIYLALEEKRGELREHFRAMGANEDDPILIHAAHAPEGALLELRQWAEKDKPALIIVDPLLKLTRVKDVNDYAQMTAALEPLLILARETGAHVLVVHHLGKGERSEAADAILGSTALFGGVDTALVMKHSERYRTIQSVQRYGTDQPETVLQFDPERRTTALGTEKGKAEQERIEAAILEQLSGCPEPQTEPEICEEVEGRTKHKRAALRDLVKAGKVVRGGKGKSGDPFRYEVSFSRSPHISGTREQDMKNLAYPTENAQQSLVPTISTDMQGSPESREQDFLPLEEPHGSS